MSADIRPGPTRARDALLGAFALALFAGAVFATWMFLKGGFEGGVPVRAVFSAPGVGQQLAVGGDVKIKGVLVGRISGFDLDSDGNAVVEMALDSGLDLPESTRAEIRSKTVFGEKWVALVPPDVEGGPTLRAGSVIPDSQTDEPVELEQALQLGHELLSGLPTSDLASIFRSLAEGFGGHSRDARVAIDKGLRALKAVNARGPELDLALRQLGEFSQWLDDNDTTLLSFLDAFDKANRALVGAAPEFKASLDSVPVFLDDLTAFQVRTEDDLGRLVEHGATLAEILRTHSDQLTDLVVELEPFTTVWNSGLKQPCAGLYESDMTCWQLYQMPGIESRGLYARGQGPQDDDADDPDSTVPVADVDTKAFTRFKKLLERHGKGTVSSALAQLLWAPLQGQRASWDEALP
jgi:phospholipid/cholesterol/gamma-HCH transport system substrate-binding protein